MSIQPRSARAVSARTTSEAGFTMLEALIATAVAAFGVLAVASMFIMGTQLQSRARISSQGVNLATAELERIRMLPTTAVERANGGSLTANNANHFAMRGQTLVRWTIADGPACGPATWAGPSGPVECTKVVTVTAIPPERRAMQATVAGLLWR